MNYGGHDGVEVKLLRNYTTQIALISEQFNIREVEMTTLQYFECLNIMRKRDEAMRKKNR
jgi:hypothetical protein